MASDTTYSSFVITGEKLDRNNYPAWKFCIQNFFMGHDLWGLITSEDPKPKGDATSIEVREWNKRARQVIHYISITIQASMIGHIQDAKTPQEAWDSLRKVFESSTKARKLQLKQQLNEVKKGSQSVTDYILSIRTIIDQLGSIGVTVDDDDLIMVTLNGLGREYKPFETSIAVRDTYPSFQELIPLLVSEEMRLGSNASTSSSQDHAYFAGKGTAAGRGRGGGRGLGGRFGFGNQGRGQQQSIHIQ